MVFKKWRRGMVNGVTVYLSNSPANGGYQPKTQSPKPQPGPAPDEIAARLKELGGRGTIRDIWPVATPAERRRLARVLRTNRQRFNSVGRKRYDSATYLQIWEIKTGEN